MKIFRILIIVLFLGLFVVMGSFILAKPDIQQDRLLQIAKEYKTYHQYEYDDGDLQWTVAACAPTSFHNNVFMSKADPKKSPHGNKLYKFFVRDINSYKDTMVKKQPIGQALVKETWNVREVNKDSVLFLKNKGLAIKKSRNNGKWYTPTTVSELFIMYKETPKPSNDKGWIYGIVSLEKQRTAPVILNKGKISTCISCHKGTKYDRIFGIK